MRVTLYFNNYFSAGKSITHTKTIKCLRLIDTGFIAIESQMPPEKNNNVSYLRSNDYSCKTRIRNYCNNYRVSLMNI